MHSLICRKSVFSITFLAFFCIGTICGVLLLKYFWDHDPAWVRAYVEAVADPSDLRLVRCLVFQLWPALLSAAAGLLDLSEIVFPPLILIKGCLLSYTAAACYLSGCSPVYCIISELLFLSMFYLVCRHFCVD